MHTSSLRLDHWPSIVRRLSVLVDLDASARAHGALVRRRGVRSGAGLLHLALLHGPGGLSLRSTAGFAAGSGIADVCDVSLLDRLRKASDFLADVLSHVVAATWWRTGSAVRFGPARPGSARLGLVDGSTISVPGSAGSDWRLHARYEPARGCFTDLALTDARQMEALARTAVRAGDVLVCDRGYGRVRNFTHAIRHGADFITRIGWRAVKLFHPDGARLDLLAALP